MSFKITGLNELQRKLEEASKTFQSLDGEIATLRFNPRDAISVGGAIVQIEAAVDARIALYKGNPLVGSVAEKLKEKYRAAILKKAEIAATKPIEP
jgi:hypothetical protein